MSTPSRNIISARLPPEEMEQFNKLAESRGLSPGEFLRLLARTEIYRFSSESVNLAATVRDLDNKLNEMKRNLYG